MSVFDQRVVLQGTMVAVEIASLLGGGTLTVPFNDGAIGEITLSARPSVADMSAALAELPARARPAILAGLAVWAGTKCEPVTPGSKVVTQFSVDGALPLSANQVAWYSTAAGFAIRSLLR